MALAHGYPAGANVKPHVAQTAASESARAAPHDGHSTAAVGPLRRTVSGRLGFGIAAGG